MDGRGSPVPAARATRRHAFLVESPKDRRSGGAAGEGPKDSKNDGGLGGLDRHSVSIGTRPALLVHADVPYGDRPIAVGRLANHEAALLLSQLTAKGLLPEVGELKFVENAADLNPDRRLFVLGVESVGHGNDPHPIEAKLLEN